MDAPNQFTLLFCLLNNKVSGGNRILLELANRSRLAGCRVDVHFADGSGQPTWFDNFSCNVLESTINDLRTTYDTATGIEKESDNYDFVFVSNLSLLPTILPHFGYDKVILISQGFESYCYGDTPTELFSAKPSLESIMQLPMRIIATSKSIQGLLQDKVGRSSYLVPVAIERNQFLRHQPIDRASMPKRILTVGDYLNKSKGIFDLADALELLAKQFPVQLVLLTQQKSERHKFDRYSFPVEFHYCPAQTEIAAIYASCHVYCCSSWYEGFGLPCLEAFSVGLPVVTTDNYGVREFARPGENILLAQPNCPEKLAEQLRCLLSDNDLASKMVESGELTLLNYTWENTMNSFFQVLSEISRSTSIQVDLPERAEMDRLLDVLEQDGFFTPEAVEQALVSVSSKLQSLCALVRAGSIPNEEAAKSLQDIREQLQQHLHNPQASYYSEFKARFDFCQLLSSFQDQRDWQKLINFTGR